MPIVMYIHIQECECGEGEPHANIDSQSGEYGGGGTELERARMAEYKAAIIATTKAIAEREKANGAEMKTTYAADPVKH